MADELDTLRFAAAEGRAVLAQPKIAKARIAKRLQRAFYFWQAGKEIQRLFNRKIEHLRDVLSVILNIQCFLIKSRAVADLAADKGRRQKVHFHLDRTGAIALRAAALRAVKVRAEEAVYIDDVAAYVEAAQRLGMSGIQFKSPSQLTFDLKSLGVELP